MRLRRWVLWVWGRWRGLPGHLGASRDDVTHRGCGRRRLKDLAVEVSADIISALILYVILRNR